MYKRQITDPQLQNPQVLNINILGIMGVSINLSGPMFYLWFLDDRKHAVQLTRSKFDIYDAEGKIISDTCDAQDFEDKNIAYFSEMSQLSINIRMNTFSFQKPICPYIFKNAFLTEMNFIEYENNRLEQNVILFKKIRNENNHVININVSIAELGFKRVYRYFFSNDSLNLLVFSSVKQLTFLGTFTIGHFFFQDLHELARLILVLDNTKQFFHSSLNQ